jgi:hypothetical protein
MSWGWLQLVRHYALKLDAGSPEAKILSSGGL